MSFPNDEWNKYIKNDNERIAAKIIFEEISMSANDVVGIKFLGDKVFTENPELLRSLYELLVRFIIAKCLFITPYELKPNDQ